MKKAIIAVIVVLLLVAVAIPGYLGLYVVAPGGEEGGRTLVFVRRLTGLPFISSADSVALARGQTPSASGRAGIDRDTLVLVSRYKVMTLPWSKALYMRSTGNRDFLSVGK